MAAGPAGKRRRSSYGPEPAFQPVAQKHRHISGVQAGQALADGEQLDKSLIVYPVVLCDQAFSQVRNNSAETGGTDNKELEEDIEDRYLRSRCLTSSFSFTRIVLASLIALVRVIVF